MRSSSIERPTDLPFFRNVVLAKIPMTEDKATHATSFLKEFEKATFNHSEELLEGIRNGDALLNNVPRKEMLSTSHYLNIWQFRLDSLQEKMDLLTSKPTQHLVAITEDMAQLCDGLRSEPDDSVQLWIFLKDPHFVFAIFVANESRQLLGCVRSVDNRLIDAEVRQELWGELLTPEFRKRYSKEFLEKIKNTDN